MALLIDIKHPEWMQDEELRAELLQHYPEADIRIGAQPGNLDEIDMLTVSTYHPGEALRYPKLRLIQKTGAGVNNILADNELPQTIQVTRLDTSTSGAEMAEYALAYVLQEQRHLHRYRQQQARSEWISYPPRKAAETTVAVLGLGRIGLMIAQRFLDNGFKVTGWSRSEKRLQRIDCHHGEQGLTAMLALADYVISVLPSTPQTLKMFNRALFSKFKPESVFINLGRGDLVDESELMQSLDAGLLAGAVLDVMSVEPLPAEHPLWLHPKVQLTPHISGYHLGDAVVDIEPLLHLVDRARGY